MNIFSSFPHAIVSGWKLVERVQSTEIGNTFVEYGPIEVIVDDAAVDNNNTLNANGIDNNLLLFVKPEQLPSTKAKELLGGYFVMDEDGTAYDLINVGIGKNQENGTIEHVELIVRETGVVNG